MQNGLEANYAADLVHGLRAPDMGAQAQGCRSGRDELAVLAIAPEPVATALCHQIF